MPQANQGKTIQLTVTNLVAVPVIAQTNTISIFVYEDGNVANCPTTSFDIRKPTSTDSPAGQGLGAKYQFVKPGTSAGQVVARGMYLVGEIAGYVQLPVNVSASTIMIQEEM